MERYKILVVEDEQDLRKSITSYFADRGHQVLDAENGQLGVDVFHRENPDIVFTDLRMPIKDGFFVIDEIAKASPETPVVVISGTGVMQDAIRAMRMGARDYILKPIFDMEELHLICKQSLRERSLQRELVSLKQQLLTGTTKNPHFFSAITTRTHAFVSILQYIEVVAPTSQPILVTGETGTGKELLAQAIHLASGRNGAFVPVNIAGLDDQVFSDTLFGHSKGAFTGADKAREGLVVQARGGTLFLDEIGDLSEQSQIKLLRLLQENEYYPLGADYAKRSDARFVLATHRNLKEMVETGAFRQDLYYRLFSHQVRIPPLSERPEDIAPLLEQFLAEAASEMVKKKPTTPPELIPYLQAYSFPGNVRELRAMACNALARHTHGVLSMDSFLDAMGGCFGNTPVLAPLEDAAILLRDKSGERVPTLKEAEQTLIANALKRANGNQGIAAGYLGISRNALNKKIIRAKSRTND